MTVDDRRPHLDFRPWLSKLADVLYEESARPVVIAGPMVWMAWLLWEKGATVEQAMSILEAREVRGFEHDPPFRDVEVQVTLEGMD